MEAQPASPTVSHSTSWLGSRWGLLWFAVRANGLRVLRGLENARNDVPGLLRQNRSPHIDGGDGRWPYLLEQSLSPLRGSATAAEAALVAGKIQNLRIAAARLDGLVIPAGQTFSFWRAIGRPSASNGFVNGRELREGCMIVSVGGGLCQISNALYAAALAAGMQIVERHAHSQTIPGSMAEYGKDATVFWNYIDLRFRSDMEFKLSVHLTHDQLVVRFLSRQAPKASKPQDKTTYPLHRLANVGAVSDCQVCEADACVHHRVPDTLPSRTAYLLDDYWPEFDKWLTGRAASNDIALVPLDGIRRNRKRYAWSALASAKLKVVEFPFLALARGLASRRLASQGAARQRHLQKWETILAKNYARKIPFDADHLVISVHLLAALGRQGVLGGRTYTVLMNRAPLAMLQRDLDRGASLHPESNTLRDFRAEPSEVEYEERALCAAAAIVTPHRAVAGYAAQNYSGEIIQLDWIKSEMPKASGLGKQLLFPASSLGRKGAFEVGAAARKLNLAVKVLGAHIEKNEIWKDVSVCSTTNSEMLADVACVVMPAFVENQPRLLLKAISSGIPVICSEECGISPEMKGVRIIPAGDAGALIEALVELKSAPQLQ